MDNLLSLSQASRLVGVPRRVLQKHIQGGQLNVFEGSIRMSELVKLYPDADADHSGMLEKVRQLQADAVNKPLTDSLPDASHLQSEVQRLRADVVMLEKEIEGYEELVAQMKQRLLNLQDQCDHKQAVLLGTLISWFFNQARQHEH